MTPSHVRSHFDDNAQAMSGFDPAGALGELNNGGEWFWVFMRRPDYIADDPQLGRFVIFCLHTFREKYCEL